VAGQTSKKRKWGELNTERFGEGQHVLKSDVDRQKFMEKMIKRHDEIV
jgi:hypothetical protein